jgi:streptogramin lyase
VVEHLYCLVILSLGAACPLPPSPPDDSVLRAFAGTGEPGFSGDNGPASRAQLHEPYFCEQDSRGNLYVADALNNRVRKIDPASGRMTAVAGSGAQGFSGDDGPAPQATMNQPCSLAVTSDGALYVVDRLNAVVRVVNLATGTIRRAAGTGEKGFRGDGGPAVGAQLREPHDCCLDGKGGLLIADVADWRIRRLDLKTGTITTFAGTGRSKGKLDRTQLGDGGKAVQAVIHGARAVCVDGQGNTYICEREGNAIRKVDAAGVITTVAGTGAKGYTGDGGPAAKATFNGPKGVRCDRDGNLFVVDTENHAIRRIDRKTGIITTVAGGRKGSGGDGGPAARAELNRPHGLLIVEDGTMYIADSGNHRIRRVTAAP